jgi:Xaa-Pro dipeptidase
MSISRRGFIGGIGAGAVGAAGLSGLAATSQPASRQGGSAALLKRDPEAPAAADFDRLPLSWYKQTMQKLKNRVAEKGVTAILLTDKLNIIHQTGLFHTNTERPFGVLIPVDTDAIFWYNPGLDRDLVNSWWSTESEYYFDYLHAEGAYPNLGTVQQGATVDLWEWILKGIRKRGFGEGTIGIDKELTPSAMAVVQKVLPKARIVNIADDCLYLRSRKTPEELALCQRAMDYFSKIHVFARDLLLEKGTDLYDFELAHAAIDYGTHLIMKDIEVDGRPHKAVGIEIEIACRAGAATAYPHPNQKYWKKIEKGDSFQVAGLVSIGGYGGECYRYYQILPWDAHREKVWQTVTDCVAIQAEESKHGVVCSNVAYKVHKHQVKQGVNHLVYHRPAHGQGMEGHQAPWLALGDYTMLEEGMTFSVEPGLFDPENGFGYNPSDLMLVTKERGLLMSSVPYTREWMIIKL